MTHEQAIAALRLCAGCDRWVTTPACDSCWANTHRCPPTPAVALAAIEAAVRLGLEAEKLRAQLRGLLT